MDWIFSALVGAVLGAAAALAWGGRHARGGGRPVERAVAGGPVGAPRFEPEPARRGGTATAEAAWRAAGDGLALLDDGGHLLGANPALEALTGFDAGALARLDLAALFHAEDRPAALATFEEIMGDRAGRLELQARLLQADGAERPVRVVLSAVVAEAGGPRRAVLVLADAAARAALERRLEEADRLASLGTLAASVANEITNPLAYLIGNMSFAREALGPGAATPPEALTQARQALDEAHEGAARVARVVSDLTALAREGPDRREPVDVPAALRAALGLATGFLQARARLQVELPPLPPVPADPARLGQAFLDLLVDAGQALTEGRPQEHRVGVSAARGLDGRVRVTVSVAATGAAAPPPRGAGGGLARCRRAVEALGGEVTDESAGATRTVTVLLPTAGTAAARPGPRGLVPQGPVAGRRARILVVDDEPYVGRTLRRMLGAQHDVEVVASAGDALARLGMPPAPEVILCDLLMPGMSGMELHAEVAARYPALAGRMVFITGGTLHAAATRFLASVPNPVLEKPFATEALAAAIEQTAGPGAVAVPAAQG